MDLTNGHLVGPLACPILLGARCIGTRSSAKDLCGMKSDETRSSLDEHGGLGEPGLKNRGCVSQVTFLHPNQIYPGVVWPQTR